MSEFQQPARGTRLPIRYVLVLWLFVLSAVAYLDRTNISIAGVQIGRDFHIDKIHLGWVFSAFLVGYACFQIPAGLLARKLGPRRLLGARSASGGASSLPSPRWRLRASAARCCS
jgi:MFS family permease